LTCSSFSKIQMANDDKGISKLSLVSITPLLLVINLLRQALGL
jgi:hypothetical protein